jgi:DNA-binding transcriptional ArsR family regulator
VDALAYARALLEPDRLAVAGLLALRQRTLDELCEATGLSARAVLAALAPLVQHGIVVQEDGPSFRLVPEALREVARTTPSPSPPTGRCSTA